MKIGINIQKWTDIGRPNLKLILNGKFKSAEMFPCIDLYRILEKLRLQSILVWQVSGWWLLVVSLKFVFIAFPCKWSDFVRIASNFNLGNYTLTKSTTSDFQDSTSFEMTIFEKNTRRWDPHTSVWLKYVTAYKISYIFLLHSQCSSCWFDTVMKIHILLQHFILLPAFMMVLSVCD